MRSRERSVAGIAGRRRLQRQPAHAAGQHRAIGESMAQRLEGADRSAELLADRNMLDGRRQCRLQQEIGRASWRERVGQYGKISVVAVSLKKKRSKEKNNN